jgi:UDP-glucuronate decarboxylase
VAETLFFDYHRQNQVDIRVVRIFNTYGPGMHPYDGTIRADNGYTDTVVRLC